MIENEKLINIYECIIKNMKITDNLLNKLGYDDSEINNLIKNEILIKNNDEYILKDSTKLYYYAVHLNKEKEYDKSIRCYKKCYELDNSNIGACFQLFLDKINKKDYNKAFEYFKPIFLSKNKYHKSDSNLYIFLLSIITDIPDEYTEYVKNLKYNDLKIIPSDKRYKDIDFRNDIRFFLYYGKIPYALKQFNELITMHGGFTNIQDVIEKRLISDALIEKRKSEDIIKNLIKEKKYNKLYEYLLKKQSKNQMSKKEKYILKLCEKLIEIKETKKVPVENELNIYDLYDAIDTNNFDIAIKICEEFNEKNKIPDNENLIYLILKDICKLNSLTKEKSKKDISYYLELSEIFSYLKKNNIDAALNSLKKYLKLIDKEEYEFIIIDLIKISLLENDKSFSYVAFTLKQMQNENYSFNVLNYIQYFHDNIKKNKIETARLYLDIISRQKSIDINDDIINNLQNILISKETEIKNMKNCYKKYELDDEFLFKKYEQIIKDKNIILLEYENEEFEEKILKSAKNYPDLVAFTIGKDGEKYIVLKYKNINQEVIKDYIEIGKKAYKEKNYEKCIDSYLDALNLLDYGRASIYGKIGLSYMMIGNILKAIDYLTVATSLSKKECKKTKRSNYMDYSELILNLKGKIQKDDLKPKFNMKIEEFNSDDNYYGIDFDEINNYIIESKMDVQSACESLNMSDEKTNIIKLIYAREYYRKGLFNLGDMFFNSVKKSKNRTKFVNKLLEEIRKNKQFYENRKNENSSLNLLSLKPNKN